MRRRQLTVLVLGGVLLLTLPVRAQNSQEDPASRLSEPSGEPKPTDSASPAPTVPIVKGAKLERRGEGRISAEGTMVMLDDHLILEVGNFQAALDADTDCYDLRLFLDGKQVDEPGPESCDPAAGEVVFNIARINRGTEEAWQNLVAKRDAGLHSEAAVSLGLLKAKAPLETTLQGRQTLTFKLAHKPILIGTAILFFITLVLFVWLARKSAILRASTPVGQPTEERPFSLSRVQMAWWFFLVLWAFLLITIVSGNIATIPGSMLGLIGIASGTYLGAEVIDAGKSQSQGAKAGEGAPAVEEGQRRPGGFYGFLMDILSDSSGVTFYRFQILAFTVAIGGIFIHRVVQQLAMPDFDAALLGLMGISSGTYVGAKLPGDSR